MRFRVLDGCDLTLGYICYGGLDLLWSYNILFHTLSHHSYPHHRTVIMYRPIFNGRFAVSNFFTKHYLHRSTWVFSFKPNQFFSIPRWYRSSKMPIITAGKLAGAQGAAILNFPKLRKPTISFLEKSPQRLILQKKKNKKSSRKNIKFPTEITLLCFSSLIFW